MEKRIMFIISECMLWVDFVMRADDLRNSFYFNFLMNAC